MSTVIFLMFAVGFITGVALLLRRKVATPPQAPRGGGGSSEPEPRHPGTVNPPRTPDAE